MLIRKLSNKGVNGFKSFLRLTYARRFSDEAKKGNPPNENDAQRRQDRISKRHKGPENEESSSSSSEESSENETQVEEEPVRERRKTNPAETSVFLFPGQGTLKVGQIDQYMCFPAARDLFEMANEILGYNLLKICQTGPQHKLDQTYYNQPATVVSSLAALEKLREERPSAFKSCKVAAGYSVGEITALIVSGILSFEDGIKLVNARCTSMHYASTKVPQGMMIAHLRPDTKISAVCKDAENWASKLGVENPVCSVAVYLYTEAKILGGNKEALDYISQNKEQYRISKLIQLPVSGAFHTMLMQPALNAVKNALDCVKFEEARCIVYSNATAQPLHYKTMKKNILNQIVRPARWEQIMQRIYNRPDGVLFPKTYDICSNGSLTTILRRINSKATNNCITV